MAKRVILVIIDGFGIGECPDSKLFNSVGANTYANLNKKLLLYVPTLRKMGIDAILNPADAINIRGTFGKMQPKSNMLTSIAGHFELAGYVINKKSDEVLKHDKEEILAELKSQLKTELLSCEAEGSIDAMNKFGSANEDTKQPIIIFSQDNCIQLLSYEKVNTIDELERMLLLIKPICEEYWDVGRIEAKIFCGGIGRYFFTPARRVVNILPKGINLLQRIKASGKEVVGIGKIEDIFSKDCLSRSYPIKTDELGLRLIEKELNGEFKEGLIIANLPDADNFGGHKNDCLTYRKVLEAIDRALEKIVSNMKDEDVLIVTSDHGNDPTIANIHHSREYVPLLMIGNSIQSKNLGVLPSMACLSEIIEEILNIKGE